MPMSVDVKLPRKQKAVFPDRCVACGEPRPSGTIRVTTHTIGGWT